MLNKRKEKKMFKSIVPNNAPKAETPNNLILFDNSTDEGTHGCSSFLEKNVQVFDTSAFKENGFMQAIHTAFSKHLPIMLVPDDIWHVFLSQISLLINQDPEKYRDSFVSHKGKEIIRIREDGLMAGNIKYSKMWESVFPRFEESMNELMKLDMNVKFTTTTKAHYTVSQIIIMDSMKAFFDYRVKTKCGFPEIRVGGTTEDWGLLQRKMGEVCEKTFVDWDKNNYKEIIDECKNVLNDDGNPKFWENLYHYEGAKRSGRTPTTSGIVNDLFPITSDGKLANRKEISRPTRSIPSMGAVCPFIWELNGLEIPCNFHASSIASWKNGSIEIKPTWKIKSK